MSLLRDIQAAVVSDASDIAPMLLKLRLLASMLGTSQLDEWVKYEMDGYPIDVEVPDYRKIAVSYVATFSGPFGSGIKNAPIPGYLIEKHCGEQWVTFEVRQSVAAIDDLLCDARNEGGMLQIDASNLILLLQGNVYEDYACNSVVGRISKASVREIQYAVRSRVLELTINIEQASPEAAQFSLGSSERLERRAADEVAQVVNQTIYGNVNHGNYAQVSNSGANSHFSIHVCEGDSANLINQLVRAGIPHSDAAEFAKIVQEDEPDREKRALGFQTRKWIGEKIASGAADLWKGGMSVGTSLATEAAMRYYGLK